MKQLLASLLITLALLPSLASAQWTNEPAGSTTVQDCSFSSTPGACTILDVYSSSQPTTDGSAPVSPSGAVRSVLYAYNRNGGSQLNFLLPQSYAEMFVGISWRTNPEFQGRNACNKMFFMKGPNSNGTFCFGNGAPQNGANPLIWFHNSANVDNSHTCALDLGLICWPNMSAGTLTVGTWYKIEAYIKKSTTLTSRDGIFRWWVNGVLAGNYTNVNYASSGLNEWVWTETWDGCGGLTCELGTINTVDWAHYLDHLYISIPNCPLGCAVPPPGPPPPPPSPPPPPPSSGDYVYQSQYSGTQGASQWSYRDTAGNLLTYNSGTTLWNGIQSYQGVWSSGFHPGTTNGTVVRWTAPAGGTATVTGAAQKGDLACGDGSTFEIKYNSASVLFTKTMAYNDGTAYPYNVSQAMTTGQTMDFIVTPGASNSCDSTMLNPTIAWAPSGASTPTISGFTPSSGAPGTSVTITGTNFVPSLSGQTVTFHDVAATVISATETQIIAQVPSAALTGTIKVITTGGTGTSGSNFTVPLSGAVEPIVDVTASALSATSATVRFTALSDGTGAAAKHDVRFAAGVISWGDAASVTSGTCSNAFAPGVTNTVVTCTITGLTTGQQYDVQLVPYRGTINVDAVYGPLSNIATVTPMGTPNDPTDICRIYREGLHPASTRCLTHHRGMP